MIPLRKSGVLLCVTATLLVACAGSATDSEVAPETGTVDISVAGQTVTKVRAVGNEVAFLQEQLASIFEDGPRRSLVLLKGSGESLQPYATPAGWSLVD